MELRMLSPESGESGIRIPTGSSPDGGNLEMRERADQQPRAIGDRGERCSQPRRGRNAKAQGNALGRGLGSDTEALKGRNPGVDSPLRPFRASNTSAQRLPRALPWAFEFCPFGAVTVPPITMAAPSDEWLNFRSRQPPT